MNIHEYQTKRIFDHYNILVPQGNLAHSDAQAVAVAESLGGECWVVKAQVHAGGRGKSGGVKLCNSLGEVKEFTGKLIGSDLVTPQTGPEGKRVRRVLVEDAQDIKQELYLSCLIDRVTQRITVIASAVGGMDIEEVAASTPEKIIRESVDPAVGMQDFQCRKIAAGIGLTGKQIIKAATLMKRLYRAFRDTDALMAEINPLSLLADDSLMALDGKMTFDSNALFRRAEITDLRDFDEEDSKELDASQHDLSYISLDGNVGCIVNGAGLAMATMDAISFYGGEPANFLDVGGGASPDKIANAFRIVLTDSNVKVVLLNIFAGINRCDWIAQGVVQALREQSVDVPVVVRLAGTNVQEGWEILFSSGLEFIHADKLDDASRKAVEAAKGRA